MTSVDVDSTEPLLPHALEILDHCHILMNALETAVKKLSWWQSMKETLSALCEFWGSRKHTSRLMKECGVPDRFSLLFKRFRFRVPDWRWEVLEAVCEDVTFVWPVMQYFDLAKMCGGDKLSISLYSVAGSLRVVPNQYEIQQYNANTYQT